MNPARGLVNKVLEIVHRENDFTCKVIQEYLGKSCKGRYKAFLLNNYRFAFCPIDTEQGFIVWPKNTLESDVLHKIRIEAVENFLKQEGLL